jgi:K+-sensing histidine kinase KdpD
MESLGSELRDQGSDSAADTLAAALEQVTRLARDVEALVDLAAPKPVAPLGCSAEEIVHAALRALPPAFRPRVRVAGPLPHERVVVDGPLLAASLEHLLEHALDEAGAHEWVLLQVRRESGMTVFAIARGGVRSILQPGPVDEGRTTPWDAHLDLGYALAQRDIDRMGGELRVETTERGCTRAIVRLPDPAAGPAHDGGTA